MARNVTGILTDAKEVIQQLRRRLEILEAQNRVLSIVERAQGGNYGGGLVEVDICYRIDQRLEELYREDEAEKRALMEQQEGNVGAGIPAPGPIGADLPR